MRDLKIRKVKQRYFYFCTQTNERKRYASLDVKLEKYVVPTLTA